MRLEAVASGRTDMGIFPEPVASIGAMNGLVKTDYSGIPEESLEYNGFFTDKAIREKRKSLEAFHRAYADAVSALEGDEETARDIAIESIPNVPPAVRDQIIIPDYKEPSLPSLGFIERIIEWTARITSKNISIRTDELFDRRFVND